MQRDPLQVDKSEVIDATGWDDTEGGHVAVAPLPGSGRASVLPPRPSVIKRAILPVVLAVGIAGITAIGALVWVSRDRIADWALLRGYQPPAEVTRLAEQAAFTPYAQRLFYVNRPVLEDKVAFNQSCPDASEEVAVLGCYKGDRRGIHLYNVQDMRLEGIIQVTAAHEMLHQAFDRLNAGERRSIGAELERYAATITDADMQEKLDAYKDFEPGELVNEMHSIFGTEVTTLPPALETYYARYFTKRAEVVAYHDRYKSAFTERQQQIEAYDAQLDELGGQIEAGKSILAGLESGLQSQRDAMDVWLRSKQIDRYNAAVPGFNAAVETYKQRVQATNTLINQYNTILDKRNKIAVQEQELLKAQDSQASAADAQ